MSEPSDYTILDIVREFYATKESTEVVLVKQDKKILYVCAYQGQQIGIVLEYTDEQAEKYKVGDICHPPLGGWDRVYPVEPRIMYACDTGNAFEPEPLVKQ